MPQADAGSPPPCTVGDTNWDQHIQACLSCGTPIGHAGSSWRICHCLGVLCEGCWTTYGSCPTCTGASVAFQQQGDHDFSLWEPEEGQHYSERTDDADSPVDRTDQQKAASTTTSVDQHPRTLTPPQALALRDELDHQHRNELVARRAHARVQSAAQVKAGTRPRKPRRWRRVDFLTMNVNCANRLKDEVLSGDLFKDVQGVFVQEHKEHGEGKDRLISWLRHRGWDPVAEDAYLKVASHGGGPLIMTRSIGIRPLPSPPQELAGRVCWGEIDVNGSVTCASVYAVSGQGVGKQLPLLNNIIQRVVAYGRPCILAGDWQVSPQELRSTGITRMLDAEVLASGLPTNLLSGGELDYFVVSRALLGQCAEVTVDPSGAFSPHMTARLSITINTSNEQQERRLRVPRLLPIDRPVGPNPVPPYAVDWSSWIATEITLGAADPTHRLSKLTEEWYAGAEIELVSAHGIHYHDAGHYRGIGRAGTYVQSESNGRYRNVADDIGLIGQRLSWVSKALWAVIVAMSSAIGSIDRARYLGLASTMAPRALAFRREIQAREMGGDNHRDHIDILSGALHAVGKAGLTVRGIPALLRRLHYADYPEQHRRFVEHYNLVGTILHEVCAAKHKKALRTVKLWARSASEKAAHRATKRSEAVASKSASGLKTHAGTITHQGAADHGMAEWGGIWKAEDHDAGDDILQHLERIYHETDEQDYPPVELPPPHCYLSVPCGATIPQRHRRGCRRGEATPLRQIVLWCARGPGQLAHAV